MTMRLAEPPLHPIASFEAVRPEWTALAERSANVFATWEWATTWWTHFGGDEGTLRLTEVRSSDGSMLAILPLYEWRRGPLTLLRFIGHGPADQLGPICDPAHVEQVGLALRAGLESGFWRCDGILGEEMSGSEGWPNLLGGEQVAVGASPVCTLEAPTWEALLAIQSKNHRREVRRAERRLERTSTLRYRLGAPERLKADLDLLFKLHDARWGAESNATEPAMERFHREFAARAMEAGWLRLWFLELDGRPAAAWYGFRFSHKYLFFMQGRDLEYEKQGVGGVLCAHTIRVALQEEATEYHFLRGGEGYKYRWADRDPGLATVARGSSPVGRLVVGSVSFLSRRRRGRRLVSRGVGA